MPPRPALPSLEARLAIPLPAPTSSTIPHRIGYPSHAILPPTKSCNHLHDLYPISSQIAFQKPQSTPRAIMRPSIPLPAFPATTCIALPPANPELGRRIAQRKSNRRTPRAHDSSCLLNFKYRHGPPLEPKSVEQIYVKVAEVRRHAFANHDIGSGILMP